MGFFKRPQPARHGFSRVGLALLLIGGVIHVIGNHHVAAAASSLAGTRATVDHLAATGIWPPAEVKPLLDVLEQETRRLLAMPPGRAATRLGEQLIPVLAKVYRGLSGRTDAMREEVLERDGDIEKFMATSAYRERETLALTALYHLSWARYQVSQALQPDAPTREQLLRSAIEGFTEFVYVNEIPEIYGDCLYGRALAFHALGETKKATEDLEEVIALGRGNQAYARARSALEAVRKGKAIKPPPPVDRTTTELKRLKELLESKMAPGEQRSKEQQEALALARALASRGEATSQRVDRLVREAGPADAAFGSFLLAEISSDRGDDLEARDHYAAAAAASDSDAATYRSRSLLGMAVASYRLGDHARAAKEFSGFLSEDAEAPEMERALYFRFKAIEASGAKATDQDGTEGGEALAGRDAADSLLEAQLAYLDRFPEGAHAAEIRYRLGEAHHARGDCARALAVIGNLGTRDAWSLRARFIVLQCQAEATSAAWRAGEPDAELSYRATLDTAREVAAEAARADDVALGPLGAKACLLGGLLAAAAPTPRSEDVVALLADFEQRFPNAADLAGDAIALRALARARLGKTEEARADIDQLSGIEGDPLTRRQQLHHVGQELMREAERGDPARRRAVLSVAQHVYAALVEPGEKATDGPLRRDTEGSPAPSTSDLAILAEVALELGDLDSAAQAYRRLLEVDPDSLEAQRGMALTAEKQGHDSDALKHWHRVEQLTQPGETLWYEATLHRVRMEDRLGQTARACAALREATAKAGLPTKQELALAFTDLERQVCR